MTNDGEISPCLCWLATCLAVYITFDGSFFECMSEVNVIIFLCVNFQKETSAVWLMSFGVKQAMSTGGKIGWYHELDTRQKERCGKQYTGM